MTKRVAQYAPHSNIARSAAAWPPEKVALLTFYVECGLYSFTEIAEMLGITKGKAIGKAQRLGLDTENLRSKPTTLNSRLDTLIAALEAILDRPRPKPAAGKPRLHMTSPEFVSRRRSA